MALDLSSSKLKRAETGRIELLHPVEGSIGLFVTVHSPGTDEYIEAQDAQIKRYNALVRRYGKAEQIPSAVMYASLVEFLADIVVDIEGLESSPGIAVPYSRKAVVDLFCNRDAWGDRYASQLATEFQNAANFSKA